MNKQYIFEIFQPLCYAWGEMLVQGRLKLLHHLLLTSFCVCSLAEIPPFARYLIILSIISIIAHLLLFAGHNI